MQGKGKQNRISGGELPCSFFKGRTFFNPVPESNEFPEHAKKILKLSKERQQERNK